MKGEFMKQIQDGNVWKGVIIEFHILQSFPVTCLNRDDVGAPKTAVIGGTTRARVSSQCWKRQIRLAMHGFGANLGTRTKLIAGLISKACIEKGATEEQALQCGQKVEQIFIKKAQAGTGSKKGEEADVAEDATDNQPADNNKTDTLLFLSPKEVLILAEAFKSANFVPDAVIKDKKPVKDVEKLIGKPNLNIDAWDIALFGRMVAQATTLNVEAASSYSHAISTHKVNSEVEFFTALDDESDEQGSAHMGSLEFNSATYYRYVSLNIGQLWETLAGQNIPEAIECFVKALFVAVPSARQTTQSGASPWEFARILVRQGQRLQVPFETAVKAQDGGFLEASKTKMCEYLDKKEKLAGSLFGKIKSFDFGDNVDFNIDKLIEAINVAIVNNEKK